MMSLRDVVMPGVNGEANNARALPYELNMVIVTWCYKWSISLNKKRRAKRSKSSLLYAASRCGEFPELQEIRVVLMARKQFTIVCFSMLLDDSKTVTPKINLRNPNEDPKRDCYKERHHAAQDAFEYAYAAAARAAVELS
uniref:Uncharacterized protein n=1 Tax=Tanacetum cinerariifolium TaxID=118510 RepID=A0A6L2P914_TANCI|nr:hypothetical protein [Tanacetum cinerariifolium]